MHWQRCPMLGCGSRWVPSCITVASDGTIWIGAADNGVSHFDGVSFTRYTAAHGLVDNEIRSIVEAPDGTIWASTINGVSRLSSAEQAGGKRQGFRASERRAPR